MTDNDKQATINHRKSRLSELIITRSAPSHYGEIPEENIAERQVDREKRGPVRVEQGDTGDVDQQP